MSPLVPPAELLGDAPVRSVGGLGQIMHAESRYVVFVFFFDYGTLYIDMILETSLENLYEWY